MKIVCDACQAKYSISDDKVRGKVFKIRCKKCSHVIVVRGTDDAGVPAEAASGPVEGMTDSAWHVVVDGAQVGPLSDIDVKARLAAGEISGETFIWKEGMTDWVKLSTLPEFESSPAAGAESDLFAPAPTMAYPPGTAETAFAATASADPFAAPTTVGTPAGAGADLFSSPMGGSLAGAGGGMSAGLGASAADARGASGGGYGSYGASPGDARSSAGNGAALAAAPVSGLTGQRHENSVLFSLSNLEALAKPAAAPVPAAAKPTGPASEGSGLIDIRAMAATTLGKSPSSAGAPSPVADLPTFAAPQFSPVAPVLLPMAQSSGTSKWVYGGLLLGAVAIVALAGVTYKVMSSPVAVPGTLAQTGGVPAAPVAPVAPAAPVPTAAPAKGTEPPVTPPPSTEEKLPPRAETGKAEAAAEKASDKNAKAGRGGGRDKKGKEPASRTTAMASAPAEAAPAREEKKVEPEKPAAAKGSLDDLLSSALSGKKTVAAAAPKPKAEEEPAKAEKSLGQLQREDIVKGMNGILPKTKDCFNQYKVPGTADAYISVGKNGRVTDAKVRGKFAGTPTGSCVEDAVKSAKFPPNDGMNFPYPIFLR